MAANETCDRRDIIHDVAFANFTEKKISYGKDRWKHNLFLTTAILNKELSGTIYTF
jgi:hypothetical protein